MNLGSEFSGESERTAKSVIIKLTAICEVVDKVICIKSLFCFIIACGILGKKIMNNCHYVLVICCNIALHPPALCI